MKQDGRLDRIEASLTPKQAMLKMLQEFLECRDLVDLARFQNSQPGVPSLVNQWTDKVAQAAEAAMKGRKREQVGPAVRRAVKDLAFLYHLFLGVNEKVMRDQRFWKANAAYFAVLLDSMAKEKDRRGALHPLPRRKRLPKGIPAGAKESEGEAGILPLWKKGVERSLGEHFLFREAVDRISRSYYDGHELLLLGYAESLAKVIDDTELIAEVFNDTFSDKGKLERIDLEALRANAAKETPAEAASLADMARMEALEFMGEHQAALELARRYV